MKDRT